MLQILEKLLDKGIHQLFKAPPISSYLSSNAAGVAARGGASGQRQTDLSAVTSRILNLTTEEARGDNSVRSRANRTNPASFSLPVRYVWV